MRRLAVVSCLLLGAAGCGGEEGNDAPRLSTLDTGAGIISFPDEYGNIAVKCFGPDLVYSARNTNGRAMAVSPSHRFCTDDGVLEQFEYVEYSGG